MTDIIIFKFPYNVTSSFEANVLTLIEQLVNNKKNIITNYKIIKIKKKTVHTNLYHREISTPFDFCSKKTKGKKKQHVNSHLISRKVLRLRLQKLIPTEIEFLVDKLSNVTDEKDESIQLCKLSE